MGKHKRYRSLSITAHTYKFICVGGGHRKGANGVETLFMVWKGNCRVCKTKFRQETPNPPDRDAILCVCDKCAKPGRPRSAKNYASMRQGYWLRKNYF